MLIFGHAFFKNKFVFFAFLKQSSAFFVAYLRFKIQALYIIYIRYRVIIN